MPLTLILGPANSAKAGEVLGAYEAAARRGALLVVPTATDAEHYSRELADRGRVVATVLTFAGLTREIARRAGYNARLVSGLARERVIRRVLAELRLGVLARSARAPGFLVAAAALMAELERAMITPQRFGQALRAWAIEDPRRADYSDDLAALYRAYVRALDRLGRVDAELFGWRALDALRARPGRWGEESVFFYGFDDLLPLERDAIETLARLTGVEVTVALTYDVGRAALSARAGLVEELRALADRVRELPALHEHYAPSARDALHHLERSLFEPQPARIDPGPAVRLLEGGGERAEAELVAAEVGRLLRADVLAQEIAVVCRSTARSGAVLERVFAEYGIPVASGRRRRFAHTTLGRSVRALARCALDPDARADDLLDYLRTPGLLDLAELADDLESELRREGLRSAAEARERLGWELDEIDALREAVDQLGELVRHARRLLALPRRGRGSLLDAAEERDAAALASLVRAHDELADIGEELRGVELLELLEALELADEATVTDKGVLITEPLAIRARRFRAVFVFGLVEGEFPQLAAGEPFLSEEQRRELAAVSGLRLAPAENALARERYLLYATVSRATEQVTFSFRSSDEEGNLVLASPFLADLRELFVEEWFERRRRRLLADVVWPSEEAPTEGERDRARAARAGADGEEALPRRLGEGALRHVRHREVVSGGALENFADCPMRWLVERELAPAPLAPDPEPLTRGSYMHSAIEEVIGRLDGPVTPQSLPDALRILDEVLAELPAMLSPERSEAVRSAAARAIAADLRRYLEHEAADGCGWEPRGLELRFGFEGEEGSLPPVTLGSGRDRVLLRGVVDRVDVDPDRGGRAIVRDYKSSSRPEHCGARWQTDRRLQVALYMIAVRELLGLGAVAGFYQPLGGGDLRARGVFLEDAVPCRLLVGKDSRSADELEEALRDAQARALALAAQLRRGELTPSPTTCSRDGCRYPGICRPD
ncbi:MAG: PD-(D/E)XK nuclease family protein [Solirubrobacterales bacterium]|nr:PD-(D/E)XK nuclease family protein [Solirubrobacterales bacterium]